MPYNDSIFDEILSIDFYVNFEGATTSTNRQGSYCTLPLEFPLDSPLDFDEFVFLIFLW